LPESDTSEDFEILCLAIFVDVNVDGPESAAAHTFKIPRHIGLRGVDQHIVEIQL